jgi:hypothetical protein
LYSVILRKKVEIKTTPQMLRYVEDVEGGALQRRRKKENHAGIENHCPP